MISTRQLDVGNVYNCGVSVTLRVNERGRVDYVTERYWYISYTRV